MLKFTSDPTPAEGGAVRAVGSLAQTAEHVEIRREGLARALRVVDYDVDAPARGEREAHGHAMVIVAAGRGREETANATVSRRVRVIDARRARARARAHVSIATPDLRLASGWTMQ